jgi:predicted AlkP superfamily pyrophosphatase or phosphodiesterase
MKRIVFFLSLIAQVSPAASQRQPQTLPYVILVSFDGFRHDYTSRYELPNFKMLMKEGASAEGLIPSFPSKTFPNHYTLVTGLYPGHHGLVDNSFFDPATKRQYGMRIREAVTDSSFYGGTPLWTLARQQGIRTASYFWVGSEIAQEWLHPNYFYTYDHSVPFQKRVDQVIAWLQLPEAERPHLITVYFSSPDEQSHRYGPLADETKKTVMAMDTLLGNLMQRVKGTGLPVNVVVVSDHGMSELTDKPETYIFLDSLVTTREGKITVANGGTQAHIYTSTKKQRDSLYTALNAKAKNFTVVKREDFRPRWHYDHARSGDLLVVAKPGKYIITGTVIKRDKESNSTAFGAHGYDPDEVPDMKGAFFAYGPDIKPGVRVKAFRNIHVYPLVAAILGLKTPPIDGELKVLAPILKKK